ncbi:MAG: hypothetical protein LAO07_15635 [Acidobacteriia bacterium]|nr:hypothetical protein [Terriglobia bacterium]
MKFHKLAVGGTLAVIAAIPAFAQTRVDLRTQAKSVDFSAAGSTKPSKLGTDLPQACSLGETFLKTDAQPGNNLYVCTSANVWSVQGSQVVPNYAAPFTAAATVTVPGTTHKLNSANLMVQVYDDRTPAWLVEPDYVLINPATYDVTVSFAAPQSGMLVLSAAGGSSPAGLVGGAVSSVFGRTGAVNAQAGDYAFDQIGGAVVGAQLPAAGGDLAGTLITATVTGLRNRPVSGAAPGAGQALAWNGTSGQWEPQTVATGSGGAGMASQLGDFLATRTSGTTLVVGSNCSAATPCNVRIGGVVYSITNSATVNLSSGTGMAYIYLDFAGNLTVGHNLALSCSSGCAAASGVTAFPANSIPLFTWSATSNTWDPTGTDRRAFLSTKSLSAGAGIVTIEAGPQTQIAVDSATVPTYLTASATLDFPNIVFETCSELTLSLPGAAIGDAITPGWPGSLEAGLIGMMRVSAANTVAVRLCNFSVAALNPTERRRGKTIICVRP